MDCARDQFFARTGLSQDNYISFGRCDSGNLGQDFLKRRAVANDVPEAGPKFVLEKLVLELEVFLLGDAAQRHHPAEHSRGTSTTRSSIGMFTRRIGPIPNLRHVHSGYDRE